MWSVEDIGKTRDAEVELYVKREKLMEEGGDFSGEGKKRK